MPKNALGYDAPRPTVGVVPRGTLAASEPPRANTWRRVCESWYSAYSVVSILSLRRWRPR